MRFLSKKTGDNRIKTLFRAFFPTKTFFSSVKVFVTTFILFAMLATGYGVYAQVTKSDRYVIQTVHVFPDTITGVGWKNVDQIGIQNLDDVSLYQEFNNLNSAYIKIDEHRKKIEKKAAQTDITDTSAATPVPLMDEADVTQTDTETENEVLNQTDKDVPDFEESESLPSDVNSDEPVLELEQTEEVIEEPPSTPEVTPEADTLEKSDKEAVPESNDATGEPVATLKKATGLFGLVFSSVRELFPFAQESTTTPAAEVLKEVPDEQTKEVQDKLTEEVPDEQAAEGAEETATTTEVIVESPNEENLETLDSESTSTTKEAGEMTETSAPSEDKVEELQETVIDKTTGEVSEVPVREEAAVPCANNCIPYTITMKGFSVPIFDQTLRMGGGQLRLSFAAKRKESRDEIQSLSVRYSVDNGTTWETSGQIPIDDEAANSINGGFYLFSLPGLDSPEALDAFQVELVYHDDPRALEGIYIESAWLELFTVKAPDQIQSDLDSLIGDDGFDPDVLSGDKLVLDDGSKVEFDNTDDNSGETLIIKSDKPTYDGLSKTTTYFSVSNTSKKEDSFSLKTYFPQGAGSVVSLEQWNQNKPKKVVIPEYRPFSYYCDAGWESANQPAVDPFAITSQIISPPNQESTDSTQSVSKAVQPSAALDVLKQEQSTSSPVVEDEPADVSRPDVTGSDIVDETDRASSTMEDDTQLLLDEEIESNLSQDVIDEKVEAPDIATTTALQTVQTLMPFAQASASSSKEKIKPADVIPEEDETQDTTFENNYICRNTNIVRTCDVIEGDKTSCVVENVKVREHDVVQYEGGWEKRIMHEGTDQKKKSFFKKAKDFLGFGPAIKDIPGHFEARTYSQDSYQIKPGETKYFKMEIEFPPLSGGEFWIEAVGDKEYGLLDPYWSSPWDYRVPVTLDNTAGTEDLTEQQVLLKLTSTGLTDFWNNVNADGSDVRFVAETAGNEDDTWYDSSWSQRIAVTVQASQVGTTLTNYPMYVDLSTLGSAFFTDVQSTGADIRITSGDGVTELPYELVAIDTGADTGELHFKADSISSSADTTFYIYFDNAGALGYAATDTYGAENVWDANYLGVYHLVETSTGAAGEFKDSTSNSNDGVGENTLPSVTTGKFGSGQDMANGHIDLGASSRWTDLGTNDEYTLSAWINLDSSAGDYSIVSQWGTGAAGVLFWADAGGAGDGFCHYGGSYAPADCADQNDQSVGSWQYAVARYDSIEKSLYIDGADTGSGPVAAAFTQQAVNFSIGSASGDDNARAFDGQMDEVRISSIDRGASWIASEYTNQNTPSTFYATSSAEVLNPTTYTELDFWLQHFDATADEADIWLQADSLPAGASTTVYMYYGNTDATTASDEFGTFTYSTTTDIYYVGDSVSTGNIVVYSLVDNNIVQLDGGTEIALNAGETTSLSGYTGSSTISVLGPVSLTIDDAAADTVMPIAFATTTFASPTNRNTSQYFVVSPFASSSVQTYIAGSAVPDESFSVATGTVHTSNTDSGNNEAVIIESTKPILAYHKELARDSFVLYPPTTDDLFGIDSNSTQLTTLTDNPDPTVYCSGGTSATVSGVTRGEEQGVNNCTQGNEGTGDAVRFSGATYPITAIQQADTDGSESTIFLPQHEFSTEYYIPTASAYMAVACSPRFGTSTIEVQTNSGTTVESATCAPSGNLPGKAYFVNGGDGDTLAFTAGHKIVSTNGVPFYVMYEDDEEDNDETNIWGAVQARKFLKTPISASYGAQEVTIDAQYEQLSYGWYQNVDAQTPTSTWPLDDGAFTTEGVSITGQGAVNTNDALRLRMNLLANVATGTATTTAFKLQYAEGSTGQCSVATAWADVGAIGSTTAAFNGYNNSLVSDGTELSSTTLASSTVFGTYEEENLSSRNPNTINPGDVGEWDWVITSNNVIVNSNYCFRMVRSTGVELTTYTSYPELETAGPPLQPTALVYFDNERTDDLSSVLEFIGTDLAGDDINYQVQIDNDVDFSSTVVDRNSSSNFLEFENLDTPSDKAPFSNGAQIRFTSPTALTASTTYWWRVRGKDPAGSNTYGEWSTPVSFTTDASVTVSEWHQTTGDQFDTDTLVNLSTSTTAVALSSSPATLTTSAIDFDDATVGNAWGEVSWNDTETSGSILYQVEYLNGSSWTLVPDSEISNNSVGNGTSPINILGLDTTIYNQIRIVATLTGTTLSVEDVTVIWGQRVETPSLLDPFDNEKTADLTPTFTFTTTDPQSDDLEYEITYGTDYTFVSSTTVNSTTTPADFANVTTPADTGPFTSGDTISYTVPGGADLIDNTTYWWKVRAKDPNGGDAWSPWSDPDTFTASSSVVVSTWFQTTEEQFDQGTLSGVYASTNDSVEIVTQIGEYGTVVVDNDTWKTVSTTQSYNNMVVVASPEFGYNGASNGRTVQVTNKTNNTFDIKAENYTLDLTGSTTVDYIVMEAGDWGMEDAGVGTRILAGTAEDVSGVEGRSAGYNGGTVVSFNPIFSATPAALTTVSTDNGTKWVGSSIDDGTQAGEITSASMDVSMHIARDTDIIRDPEDIDYLVFDVATGTNNGVLFDAFNSPDGVTESDAEYTTTFNQAFSSAPGVIVVQNNGTDGADGGFAQVDTDTPTTNTSLYMSLNEMGVGSGNHTTEIVSVMALESASGTLDRYKSGTNLTGTIASEPVLFSDGSGPKFEQYLFSQTSPANSTTSLQVQYLTSTSSWALIPDSQIPGNSTGTTTSPVDLTNVDVSTYPTIRLYGTLTCDGSSCPTLDDWAVEWSEGVSVSGLARAYDRSTNVTSGTVRIAINGSLIGNTGTILADGTWTVNNVTAFDGDVITVFVDGAAEANEAVSVFVYDGVGDVTNVDLFEQHLTISADETATTTNALLGAYDNSVSGDEDIFFDVDTNNDLTVCAITGCSSANLYIGAGNVFIPATSTAEVVNTHDFVNDGTVALDGNTVKINGSWENNATLTTDTSSVVFTATSTTESIADISGTITFNNVTFGETSGTAVWQAEDPYDINGDLTVDYGTFDRASSTITVAGDVSTGAGGFWSGIASTTFDGTGTHFWSDANTTLQNVGNVVVNGSVQTISMSSDVRAQDIHIESGNTLNAGGANSLYISGNFTNNNVFTAQTGTLVVDGSGTNSIIDTGASSLYNLTASTTDNGTLSFNQTSLTMLGDFTIATGTVTMPSVSTSIGGSFANTGGVFAHNNADVIFTGSGTETIQQQGTAFLNAFYDVTFTGSGAWSWIDGTATTSNDFDIQNGTVTLPSGQLTVGGLYSTTGSGAFVHNNGEVVLLIQDGNTVLTNGSSFNDVRIKSGGGSGVWYSNDWGYRKAITISASAVDATLTNFPVYVDMSDFDTTFFSNINADAGDIRVTEGDGLTEVAREIVAVDTGLETGEMYFNATSISSTTNTTFYVYYGNSGVSDYAITDTYGAENTWNANYLGVYHMNATSTGASGEFIDSTNNSNDGTGENTLPVPTTGVIGTGQDMSGGHIDLGSGFADIGTNDAYTVAAWVNLDTTSDYSVVSQWGGGSSGFLWWADAGGTGTGFCHYTDGVYTPSSIFGTGTDCQSDNSQQIGAWQYLAITYDADTANTFVNGATTGTQTTGLSFAQAAVPFSIGSVEGNDNTRAMDGQMDEVRISSIDRGAAWVAAEYTNQSTSTDFYSISTSESAFVRTFSDTNTSVLGDLIVESGEAVFPTGVLSVGGSFDNNGVFNANSGTVKFDSVAGAETIAAGSSTFATLYFDSSLGNFTVIENATATVAVDLTDAIAFTLNSGVVLESAGTFYNELANASSTWTGSTLKLTSGTDFAINAKDNGGDTYATLLLTGDTDINMWNSTAGTYTTNNTASIYSQDHAGTDGDLYIFGDYVRESGTEHWSYATDFDGADLVASSSERQVNVRVESGASVTASSSVLSIAGIATASTTIDAQSGTFALLAQTATVTASYFEMTGTDVNGFNLTSSSTVTSLDNAQFTIGAGVSAVTVDAGTINTTPAKQFFNTNFVTGGGSSNVTLSGSPASYWWFRDGAGDRYGEAFDNADGDPGSIRWDDSSYTINVSGVVYADDGSSALGGPTCDGVTNVVRIVVDNGAYTDIVPCNGLDGSYLFSNVAYVGDANMIVYLDTNGGVSGSVLTKTPTADITDLDIYANRVMTRHEDTAVMTIADMAVYDGSNDSDIRFTAATSTIDSLTLQPDTELYVFATTTFTPGGVVTLQSGGSGQTYDGSLHIGPGATFTGSGTTTYSVGGSFLMEPAATFVSASSTVSMTATTSGKTVSASSEIALNELEFVGVGGGWNLNADIAVSANMHIATGTVTGTGDITVLKGSMYGNGTVSLGAGTVVIEKTNTLGGTLPWLFNDLTLGSGSVVGTTTPAGTATTTVGGVFTINTAHFLDAGGSVWDLTGSGNLFIENGTFLEGTSTVQYGGTANANALNTTYYNLNINTPAGSPTITADTIGLQVLNNLRVGGAGATNFTLDTNDPTASVSGDVFIASNGTLIGSDSATLTVSGSWDNNGTFTSSAGLIDFDSADAFTLAAGDSPFGDVLISGTGAASVTENATSTGTWTLASTSDFTANSGARLAVGGLFTNTTGGAATTWTGSTLHLFGTGSYEINASSTADTYDVLSAAAGTHIRMWNSDASSYVTASGGSIYSMDHLDTAGDLYIFGDYIQNTQTDYWNYATNFDGATLSGGARRQVDVYLESGSTATWQAGGLTVLGTSTASTTLQNQGSGTYSLTLGGSSAIDWSYATVRDIDSDGITFTGAPTVTEFAHTNLLVATNNATAITVGGTAIDASPAKNFTQNTFDFAGGVTGAVNVTATGTTVSSWRYTNSNGALSGEAFDSDPAGDPGYIVWDDSTALITVAGNVYSDEGSTVSAVCDGVTPNVRLRIAGLTTASTSCNATTGAYSISNVTFSANDTLTLYISGEAVQAANVSIDPISSISDMDLYENRVIVRHENTDPITIADMAVWDSSDDADIPFTAVDAGTDTLTLPSNTKLVIWDSKEFAPAGDITLAGAGAAAAYDGSMELYDGATFTAAGTENHSIGGSLVLDTSATFTAASSTITFTTTGATRTIDVNDQTLNNVVFNGSGSWAVTDTTLTADGDVRIDAGAVTLPTGTTTLAGSFENTGGSFVANGGLLYFTAVDSGNVIEFGGSSAASTTFDGVGGAWSFTDTNATSTGSFTVDNGSVTLPSGVLAVGADFVTLDTITHNSGVVKMLQTSGTAQLTISGNDLYSLYIAGGATTTMTDASSALLGDLAVASGTLAVSTSTLSIGGSLDATGGIMNTASGTILFNSSDTGEVVNPGSNNFYNVVFGSASGGWTLLNATTSNNFALSSASSFTMTNGDTLVVDGVFSNLVGGAATTWTGSTVHLTNANTYEINTKSAGGDAYNVLEIIANADISAWDSSVATLTLATSSSYYSQDNAGINGDLYIYGDFHVSTSTEYWSYATDFDGAALGGSPRIVNVYMDANATTTVDGGSLQVIGAVGASTTVQATVSSNDFAFAVESGTLNAAYYEIENTDTNGLYITGTPTISDLSNGSFLLTANTGSAITVTAEALNANASKIFTNVGFSASSSVTGFNVELTVATTSNAWRFTGSYGDIDGEGFDSDGTDACGSIRWDDSSCLLVEQTHYRWRNDDGGLGVPDSEWMNTSWSKRKRVRVTNADTSAYSSTSVKTAVVYDADMQADFEDLRFTTNDGITEIPYWIEKYTPSTDAVVWLSIDSLPASDAVDLYMYYGNVSATSTSSSSDVFITSDGFEDGNITEYSGDTGIYSVDGSFAYGGSSGLDATGNEGSRATNGIARFDLASTSQGQIIRYMQYVDTTTGGSDESCALFGVQSPVTAKNNYGVCLELFGVDRMSLVKDVESTDTYGAVSVLATTTVTYTTGWYEIEIDWQTDNTIDVSLYTEAGTLVATTSSTDGTYTDGGFGFTSWGQNGGWDSFTSRVRTDTPLSVAFGNEQVRGGATWNVSLDTASNGFELGDVARIRFAVENTGLDITNQAFQLEFADKGSAPSCEAVATGDYAVVPPQSSCGVSGLCMATSSYYIDGTPIADLLEETAGTFVDGYAVEDPSNTASALDIHQNNYTELEYALTSTINAASDAYCLRVTNAGAALDSYAAVAEYALAYDPSISAVSFNSGNNISLLPGTTTRVYATATVTDLNGYSDLIQATSTMYTTLAGAACTADNNDCYISTEASHCSFMACAGNSCELQCYADYYYHADATDVDGSNEWWAFFEVNDAAGGYDFATSPSIDLNTLRALEVTNLIDYGALAPSSNTGATNASTTVENLGNDAIDVQIVGDDLSDGYSSTIPADQQIFATSTFDYQTCTTCTTLATTSITYEVDLAKPTTNTPPTTDQIFWGIAIPFGVGANPYTGHNTFYAVSD